MQLKVYRFMAATFMMAAASWTAASADTVTEGFDNATSNLTTLPEGWNTVKSSNSLSIENEYYKTKKPSIAAAFVNTTNYLITPALQGEFSFWLRNQTKNYQAEVTAYACTYTEGSDGGSLQLGEQLGHQQLTKTSGNTPTWTNVKFNSASATRVALLISRAYFDDFTYTPATLSEGPSLVVADFENGADFDFGTVKEGTEKTFSLINQGTASLQIISISVSGDFLITSGELTTIEAGGKGDVTVATPSTNSSGTLRIESNDPDSPYLINLTSTYKEAFPVMTVTPAKIDFEKVMEDATATITISNSGDALLKATIAISEGSAVDASEFSVSESSVEVEPGESKEVTLTFHYNTDYFGIHSATVTVTPNHGDPATVTATAFVKDPDLWEEDFEGGEMPQGWTTTGWTVTKDFFGSNGTYMAFAGITSSPYELVTPRLYAAEGQVLEFEVGGGIDSSDKLTVEYSHDQNEWTPIEGSPLSSVGTTTFTAPEEGYYYLRFKGRYGAVDNFSGFRLALKERDMAITAHSIPAEGHQYVAYTATATVQEMMGNAESATAVLYLDGVEMAREEAEIEAGATHTFTLTFTPEEGFEGAQAFIEVTFAETESLKTEPVTVTIAEAPVWDENEVSSLGEGTIPAVVFNYTPTAGWNTISVPFALDDAYLSQIFGESYAIFELKEYADGVITFREALNMGGKYAPGYPYVVYVGSLASTPGEEGPEEDAVDNDTDSQSSLILKNVKIEQTEPKYEEKGGVKFSANFAAREAAEGEDVYEIEPVRHGLQAAESLKGFRGYVTLDPSITTLPAVRFVDGAGVETGIGLVESDRIYPKGIFNLNGQRVSEPLSPGIYIIDGRKTVKK